MENQLRVKNWKQFQHFKDRRPPWIKLYRDLLDDPEWHELDGDTAKALIMFWLIASDDKQLIGKLPDLRKLAFRARLTTDQTEAALSRLSHWLEEVDIKMISTCRQPVIPETEGKKKTKKETQADSCAATDSKLSASPPPHKRIGFDCRRITGVEPGDIESWKVAYPACDVEADIARASAWLVANPAKRKKNVCRFLIHWLARTQEHGGDRFSAQRTGTATGRTPSEWQTVYLAAAQAVYDVCHSQGRGEHDEEQVIRSLRDKYRDCPKLEDGRDAVKCGIEFGRNATTRPGSQDPSA